MSSCPFWRLCLYPAAGEAGGCFGRPTTTRDSREGSRDPERSAAEAARRARGKIRRYCAANRLNRFGTLTYAGEGCFEPSVLTRHVGLFFRGLRVSLGGEPLPYVWVPEWHPGGHGLHVHFTVGRYVSQPLIRDTWGRGFVNIKLIGDLPVGSGSLEEARVAAGYLAKYVGKSFEDDSRIPGLHRYEVAQGFQPQAIPFRGLTLEDVTRQAAAVMGREPAATWRSQPSEGQPPTCLVTWND